MSLTDVIERLATGTYQVDREGATTYDTDGRPVTAAGTSFQVRLVVQPAGAKELLRLPEGDRTGDLISVWSATELQLRDVVTVDGAGWQVEAAGRWTAGAFWECLARKVTP